MESGDMAVLRGLERAVRLGLEIGRPTTLRMEEMVGAVGGGPDESRYVRRLLDEYERRCERLRVALRVCRESRRRLVGVVRRRRGT